MSIASSRSFGLDHEVAAELLARLRERAVGDEPFAVAHADAGRRGGRVQWRGGEELPAACEIVRELRRLAVALLPRRLIQRLLVP